MSYDVFYVLREMLENLSNLAWELRDVDASAEKVYDVLVTALATLDGETE